MKKKILIIVLIIIIIFVIGIIIINLSNDDISVESEIEAEAQAQAETEVQVETKKIIKTEPQIDITLDTDIDLDIDIDLDTKIIVQTYYENNASYYIHFGIIICEDGKVYKFNCEEDCATNNLNEESTYILNYVTSYKGKIDDENLEKIKEYSQYIESNYETEGIGNDLGSDRNNNLEL